MSRFCGGTDLTSSLCLHRMAPSVQRLAANSQALSSLIFVHGSERDGSPKAIVPLLPPGCRPPHSGCSEEEFRRRLTLTAHETSVGFRTLVVGDDHFVLIDALQNQVDVVEAVVRRSAARRTDV